MFHTRGIYDDADFKLQQTPPSVSQNSAKKWASKMNK